MYCFYINSVEGEVKGRKFGYPGTCFETPCKTFLFYVTLNGKGILMVRLSLLLCSFSLHA
jgi:hypothetical protein